MVYVPSFVNVVVTLTECEEGSGSGDRGGKDEAEKADKEMEADAETDDLAGGEQGGEGGEGGQGRQGGGDGHRDGGK
jgi:hypothetical protein